MKKITLIILILFTCISNAQTKKWSLKDCINYALENNISIQQSELNLKTASINKKDAQGNFLPDLNARMSHNWSTGLNTDPGTNTNVTATTQSSRFLITSNITIYDGLKNVRQLHRANLNILANQYQLDDMKDNISLQIANAYLQVTFNKESLNMQKKQFELNLTDLKRTQEQVNAGTKPKGDLLEIEANIAAQEQRIINAENLVRIAKINLTNLLRIKDHHNFDILESIYKIEPLLLEKNADIIYQRALKSRNDIKASETRIQLREDDLKISKSDYLPTLTGNYNFGTNYFNSELFNSDNFFNQLSDKKSHSFGLTLNIPIFNKYQVINNVKRSQVNLEKSKLSLEQNKIDLKNNIQQSYNDVLAANAVYNASQKTLAARKEAFRYSQERFDTGLMNSFDYNQAKIRLESAENEVIRAKYDYIFKTKVLEFYFGVPLNRE